MVSYSITPLASHITIILTSPLKHNIYTYTGYFSGVLGLIFSIVILAVTGGLAEDASEYVNISIRSRFTIRYAITKNPKMYL